LNSKQQILRAFVFWLLEFVRNSGFSAYDFPGEWWLFFYFVATFEALHSAGGIDYLLLTGEEWMAFAAQLHSERLLGGAGSEDVAAGADYLSICVIFGMYLRSHFTCSL
jgi:hypothetical protein